MSLDLFFWKDPRDPYAMYDVYGDRHWTGGSDKAERIILALKLLEFK